MKQPIEPSKEDCCNSGCNPCIFDVYERQLQLYKKFSETGQFSEDQPENALSQLEFTTFVLVNLEEICESHIQLFFSRPSIEDGKQVRWKPGDHFLVKYNVIEISCTRAYTPVKCKKPDMVCDFSIIIKVYERGLVSKYLGQMEIGNETLWRGPYGCYELSPNKFKRMVMIAQGTGIAPFISIIESILNDENDMTKVVLYYCTRKVSTILFRDELYSFKEYWNFSYKIFLSSSFNAVDCKYQEPIIVHKLSSEDISLLNPTTSSDQVLLCGSQEFINDIKLFWSENSSINIVIF